MCTLKGVSRLDLAIGIRLASRQSGTHMEHARELKGHDSWSTTGQKFQFGQIVSSRLRLATHFGREVESLECPVWMKTIFSHSSYTTISTLIPMKCRELPKRILREKP